MLVPVLVVLLIGAVIYKILKNWIYPYDIPTGLKQLPGPWGVPLLGSIPWMIKETRTNIFLKWRKIYGDIFMVPVGNRHMIVIHDIELIRQAYAKDPAFAGRPDLTSVSIFINSGGQSRFAGRTGNATWRFLRKSAVKALGLFATSKNSRLNDVTTHAASDLVQALEDTNSKPVDTQPAVFECTAKVIGTVLFGGEYSKDDPMLQLMMSIAEVIGGFVGSIIDFFPLSRYWGAGKINKFLEDIGPLNDVTERLILSHDCSNAEDDIRDVADALYVTAVQTPNEEKAKLGIDDDKIRFISQDLFGAGFSTVMDSIRWSLNLLAKNPDKQSKAQEEIDRIIGDRPITLDDLHMLPYVDAVLLEIFRIASLVPLAVPHAVMHETSLNGYYIPKGCMVFVGLYAHHRDERYFPEPYEFRPERFIKQDGTLDMSLHEMVVPFGVGKRRCVGENLARQELFVVVARILQRLSFRPAPGVQIDMEACKEGVFRVPLKYELVFTKRK